MDEFYKKQFNITELKYSEIDKLDGQLIKLDKIRDMIMPEHPTQSIKDLLKRLKLHTYFDTKHIYSDTEFSSKLDSVHEEVKRTIEQLNIPISKNKQTVIQLNNKINNNNTHTLFNTYIKHNIQKLDDDIKKDEDKLKTLVELEATMIREKDKTKELYSKFYSNADDLTTFYNNMLELTDKYISVHTTLKQMISCGYTIDDDSLCKTVSESRNTYIIKETNKKYILECLQKHTTIKCPGKGGKVCWNYIKSEDNGVCTYCDNRVPIKDKLCEMAKTTCVDLKKIGNDSDPFLFIEQN
jgi:hypothetical protein